MDDKHQVWGTKYETVVLKNEILLLSCISEMIYNFQWNKLLKRKISEFNILFVSFDSDF